MPILNNFPHNSSSEFPLINYRLLSFLQSSWRERAHMRGKIDELNASISILNRRLFFPSTTIPPSSLFEPPPHSPLTARIPPILPNIELNNTLNTSPTLRLVAYLQVSPPPYSSQILNRERPRFLYTVTIAIEVRRTHLLGSFQYESFPSRRLRLACFKTVG